MPDKKTKEMIKAAPELELLVKGRENRVTAYRYGRSFGMTWAVLKVRHYYNGYVFIPREMMSAVDRAAMGSSYYLGQEITFEEHDYSGSWLGFDTQHYNDVWPDDPFKFPEDEGFAITHWTPDKVVVATIQLAKEIANQMINGKKEEDNE